MSCSELGLQRRNNPWPYDLVFTNRVQGVLFVVWYLYRRRKCGKKSKTPTLIVIEGWMRIWKGNTCPLSSAKTFISSFTVTCLLPGLLPFQVLIFPSTLFLSTDDSTFVLLCVLCVQNKMMTQERLWGKESIVIYKVKIERYVVCSACCSDWPAFAIQLMCIQSCTKHSDQHHTCVLQCSLELENDNFISRCLHSVSADHHWWTV